MIAACMHAIGEPMRVEEMDDPRPGRDEVLVRVCAAGICGSDLHILRGETPIPSLPRILGHEIAGVIVDGGDTDLPISTRVCVDYLITCGTCRYCRSGYETLCQCRELIGVHRDGGFAEYVVAPRANVLALPSAVGMAEAAILVDALATPFHAITKRMRLRLGDTVTVVGAGGLGQLAVQLLRLAGAGRIIALDVDDAALQRALEAGATDAINVAQTDGAAAARNISGGGADFALELVGRADTRSVAVATLRPGGRAVLVGHGHPEITLPDAGTFIRGQIEVAGSYAAERAEISLLIDLVASGRIRLAEAVSHRVSLQEVNEGLDLLRTRRGSVGRIVVCQGES